LEPLKPLKSPFDGNPVERAVYCSFCNARLKNDLAGQPCPLCKNGQGVWREVQNNFPDSPGKKPKLPGTNDTVYIDQNKPIRNDTKIAKKEKDTPEKLELEEDVPMVSDTFESEEFKQLLMPKQKIDDVIDEEEIQMSADFLAIDG